MFRYENIIIAPVDSGIVTFADPELDAYIIFDVGKSPVTSLGLYGYGVGVEYIVEPIGDIHGYKEVGVESPLACCHWILPYVDRNTLKDGGLAGGLGLYAMIREGRFQLVFDYMKIMLENIRDKGVLS